MAASCFNSNINFTCKFFYHCNYIFHDFNFGFLGGYPLKYIGYIIGAGILSLTLFILIAKAFPDAMPNRVNTWGSRIENFSNSEGQESYQVEKAKIAIATGGTLGKGPGKSIQKNFLPQSSSDFIYAIIVEEYGLVGAVLIVFVYFLLLFRIFVTVKKASTIFGTLLVLGWAYLLFFKQLLIWQWLQIYFQLQAKHYH